MRRSTSAALVVGMLAGFGVQFALAQPVDPGGSKVRNFTVTNSLAVGNDVTVGDDLTVTDTLKVAVLDAGVALINGDLRVLGSIHNAAVSAIELGAASRITWGGGNYIKNNSSSGRMWSTGGVGSSNFALGAGEPGALMDSSTAPTLSGGCTSPAVTWNNGSAAFQIDVGTSCGVSTITVTLPTAANGWMCSCANLSTADRMVLNLSGTTTTAVLTNVVISTGAAGNWADGADVRCQCRGG